MFPALVLTVALLVTESDPACFGMTSQPKGFQWTYAGTLVRYVENRAKTERVTWASTVIATREVDDVRLALIEGFVRDLAWAAPTGAKRRSLLMCSAGRLLILSSANDGEVLQAFANWDASILERSEVLLETPLRDGQVFGQDPPRDDAMYGWLVSTKELRSHVPASCSPGRGQAYRLTHRFMTDHSIVEWWPGVGITSFEYEHHGTPEEADVRLVSCRLPGR